MFLIRILCVYRGGSNRSPTNFFNLIAFIVVLVLCIPSNSRKGAFTINWYLQGTRVREYVLYISVDVAGALYTQ